jgi:hypothetical protein
MVVAGACWLVVDVLGLFVDGGCLLLVTPPLFREVVLRVDLKAKNVNVSWR